MNTKRKHKTTEFLYVKILEERCVVSIHETWKEASVKPRGKVRKIPKYNQRALFKLIFEYWKGLNPEVVKEWKAPTWVIDEWLKRNDRNKVWATSDPGNGKMYFKFDYWTTPITIEKTNSFYLMYDKNLYIYEKIIEIAKWTGLEKINIITDLVDLLRINKIYSTYFDIDIKVTIGRTI